MKSPVLPFNLLPVNPPGEGFVNQGGSLQDAAAAFASPMAVGQSVEFLVNEGSPFRQGVRVSMVPGDQQLGDVRCRRGAIATRVPLPKATKQQYNGA